MLGKEWAIKENCGFESAHPKVLRDLKISYLEPVCCKKRQKRIPDQLLHRGAFCQFPFWWIYYCHSRGWTEKEYTNVFKSGGNILGQSASKRYNKLFIIKFPHFKGNLIIRLKNVSVLFFCSPSSKSTGKETGKTHLCVLVWGVGDLWTIPNWL